METVAMAATTVPQCQAAITAPAMEGATCLQSTCVEYSALSSSTASDSLDMVVELGSRCS